MTDEKHFALILSLILIIAGASYWLGVAMGKGF